MGAEFTKRLDQLTGNIERFVRGRPEAVRQALVCFLAEGHLLIEDVPGVAKTSLAMAIARSVDTPMGRIQFTPDLLPSDVTGVHVFDQSRAAFEFRRGPVFAHVVLADEINRAAPKTQSALLEVMAERQVTVDGLTMTLPRPFLCVATRNPIEHQGTYRLPEAQLDRFLMMIKVGYPAAADESDIVAAGLDRRRAVDLQPVLSVTEVLEMIDQVRSVHVAPSLRDYLVRLATATRDRRELRLGASPRGTIALAQAAQSHAACAGRDFATADDVQAVVVPVLRHRLLLAPEYVGRFGDGPADDAVVSVLAEIVDRTPVPTAVR